MQHQLTHYRLPNSIKERCSFNYVTTCCKNVAPYAISSENVISFMLQLHDVSEMYITENFEGVDPGV